MMETKLSSHSDILLQTVEDLDDKYSLEHVEFVIKDFYSILRREYFTQPWECRAGTILTPIGKFFLNPYKVQQAIDKDSVRKDEAIRTKEEMYQWTN